VLLAWATGLTTRVDSWGPPPLEKMTKLFLEMNKYDIDARISNERGHVRWHVKLTAALVDHPPVVPAFAYRFDARDRSIVISGDTAPSQNLVKLAAGADVLVHSVMYPPAIDRLVARAQKAAALRLVAQRFSAANTHLAGLKPCATSVLIQPIRPLAPG